MTIEKKFIILGKPSLISMQVSDFKKKKSNVKYRKDISLLITLNFDE